MPSSITFGESYAVRSEIQVRTHFAKKCSKCFLFSCGVLTAVIQMGTECEESTTRLCGSSAKRKSYRFHVVAELYRSAVSP